VNVEQLIEILKQVKDGKTKIAVRARRSAFDAELFLWLESVRMEGYDLVLEAE
jgi:hypothetical protein